MNRKKIKKERKINYLQTQKKSQQIKNLYRNENFHNYSIHLNYLIRIK
jgi:membrane protein insertase Oxa1/YidC/SpoIIIJ